MIRTGVTVMTDSDEAVGESQAAAKEGISKVVVSRMAMAAPGMVTSLAPRLRFLLLALFPVPRC